MVDFCYACGKKAKEKRFFNSKKGVVKRLTYIFTLYSKIDVPIDKDIFLCRNHGNCHDSLLNLHEHVTSFKELCEETHYKSRPYTAVPLPFDIQTNIINDTSISTDTVSCETPQTNRHKLSSTRTGQSDHSYGVKNQKPATKKPKVDKTCRQLFPPLCDHDHTYYEGSVKETSVFNYPDLVKQYFESSKEEEICVKTREQVASMNNRTNGFVSSLMNKYIKDMEGFNWEKIVEEFSSMLPLLFKVAASAMMPRCQEPQKMVDLFPRLGMIYAIIMQSRHLGLSLVQVIVSMVLMENTCICDQKMKYCRKEDR